MTITLDLSNPVERNGQTLQLAEPLANALELSNQGPALLLLRLADELRKDGKCEFHGDSRRAAEQQADIFRGVVDALPTLTALGRGLVLRQLDHELSRNQTQTPE